MMGCGGGAASTATSGEGEATSGGQTPAIAWADMNDEQRGEYMANVVMPRMRTLFQEHDPEEFASFTCATCHGENAREVGFHMPNGLHPLNPAEIPAMFTSNDEHTRETAQFMAGPVVQTMAELLGTSPYDPQTHQGFGCMGCHATAQ